jgi:membrane protease YdiL (CAAX protease family)
VPGETNVEQATPSQPVETTIAEVSTSRGKIRWWDLFFIALHAYLGWFIFCFVFGLVGGVLYFAVGYGTDPDAFAAAASRNFYFIQISGASFYLAVLLATRRVLRKGRGRGSFAGYFPPIGGRRLLYAALSGLVLSGTALLLLLAVLWSAVYWRYHPTAGEVLARPHSPGRLAVLGLICVVLAPLTEEMFFRGLLLEWFQQRLARLPSALVTATIFALSFTLSARPEDRRLDRHRGDRGTRASLCTVGSAHPLLACPGRGACHLQCHPHARGLLMPLT